jgi:hypothetical protein
MLLNHTLIPLDWRDYHARLLLRSVPSAQRVTLRRSAPPVRCSRHRHVYSLPSRATATFISQLVPDCRDRRRCSSPPGRPLSLQWSRLRAATTLSRAWSLLPRAAAFPVQSCGSA